MIENGQPNGSFNLHHGGKRVTFTVDFRKRTKLAITVHPDMRVEVAAPVGSPLDRILARVEKRAGWILKQLRFFEQYQPTQPNPGYISGETHVFLGRQYRLKVRVGSAEGVKLIGRFFLVWVKDRNDTASVQRLVESWHRDHAERLFAHRLGDIVECTRSLGLKTTPRPVDPKNGTPLGKLHKSRKHTFECRFDQSADSLHRLRDCPRTVSFESPQSRPGILPAAVSLHARLEKTKTAAGMRSGSIVAAEFGEVGSKNSLPRACL